MCRASNPSGGPPDVGALTNAYAPELAAAAAASHRTFEDFGGVHDGETILVCGCGASLAELERPERFITIGVNDVGRQFDPDYLVVLNSRHQFSGDRFKYVEGSRARAVFSQLRLEIPHPHLVTLKLGKRGGADVDGKTLPYTRNSPYVAVALAIHMGARRIGLLGVDFTDHHFFGRTGRHSLNRELPQIDAEYARLNDVCRARGIELFNVSPVSRLTSLPRQPLDEFARLSGHASLRFVSYATTPVAGVPAVLARCITARAPYDCRTVWSDRSYGNGVSFDGDVEYVRDPRQAVALLEEADVVVLHNGKVAPQHAKLVEGKGIVTLAHNYRWNVDTRWVDAGFPGLVVAQYQATLAEFAGWTAVPNPVPFWEPAYQATEKNGPITIAYTPSGRHESYPQGHRLYWHGKGYHTTMAVLDRLAARHQLQLEVIRARQVSHADSLAMKRRAHIVIDECVTGSYHRNSLEALSVGAVAVNGIGILPGMADVLRSCTHDDAGIPFVCSTLATLEQTLESLIASGAERLVERGAAGRSWMEKHWEFGSQWERYWQPAVDRALDRAGRVRTVRRPLPRPSAIAVQNTRVPDVRQRTPLRVTPARAPAPSRVSALPEQGPIADASVIVPHGGGGERLRNLGMVLAALRKAGMADVIVVEMGTEPLAEAVATASGARYVFVAADRFHKARAMNVGVAFVRTSRFFWVDSDLLLDGKLLRNALVELEARRLDCLVPWTSVRYLDLDETASVAAGKADPFACHPINTYYTRRGARGGIVLVRTAFVQRYGGMCEEFHGWGGEDNAWFLKAAVLGRAAATNRVDEHAFHLYHPLSGGHGPQAAMAANPEYARNLALLQETRRLTSRDAFLRRFPPPSCFPAPWAGVRRVAGDGGVCAEMRALWGDAVVAAEDGADFVIGAAATSDDTPRDRALSAAMMMASAAVPPCMPAPQPVRMDLSDTTSADLSAPWPWPDDSIDVMSAHDVLGRVADKVHLMNELWRVLRHDATAEVSLLTTDGPGAFADPRCVSYWNRRSFDFVEHGSAAFALARERAGSVARFHVEREQLDASDIGPRLTLTLRAVKA
ncbi:MAG: hypothetical protein JWM95_4419 [Gemmatimonadetes bacterium]|nr:hypothetical protein [Gemmatimonadota bacterium]